MTRTARKGKVSAQFFRVDGADLETGEETFLVLQAPTKPQAEKLAREQGMLISAVRVARPDDWQAAPAPEGAEPQPQSAPVAQTMVEPQPQVELQPAPEPQAEPSPFLDVAAPIERSNVEPAPRPLDPAPPLPSITPQEQGSSAGAVFLGFIGGALVIGGVLALVLALWHDNSVRNELEQIEFRLYQLIQTILGGILVLGGLLIFSLSVICHMLAKRSTSS